MSYEQLEMSSFQRIGDKHLIGDKEGTPQQQRNRKGQVHSFACGTSASKAPACPPEQYGGDPSIYEDDTPEDIEMDRKADLRRCAADLLLVEQAKAWLLGEVSA